MNSVNDVLKKVIGVQERCSYSDQYMANIIGCSRPLYQRTRTGKIPVGGTFLKGAMKLLASEVVDVKKPIIDGRKAIINRETGETNISIELDIDGSGKYDINTGTGIFDHLLSAMMKHGKFDIKLSATGDDIHHIVEDVAICLGKAFGEALGEKRGIVRMANVAVPMDEALAMVAVDIGGRGYAVLDLPFSGNDMPGFPADLIRHFLESLAIEARINLHASIAYGTNDHHKAEALFKALGRALDAAIRIDERISDELPSTKGYLEG
jgi:imidazoleglycerol-phosphate dehydratase